MTDISREAVERLVRDTWDASSSSHVRCAERALLALRAALDAAEARPTVAEAARVPEIAELIRAATAIFSDDGDYVQQVSDLGFALRAIAGGDHAKAD